MKATPVPESVALVAEHHLHDVDRGAEVVGDALRLAVVAARAGCPTLEHGLDRAAQLFARLGRELAARARDVDPLERGDELAQVVGAQIGVAVRAALRFSVDERGSRSGAGRFPSTTSPYIWIEAGDTNRTRNAGCRSVPREPLDGIVVQAEVQDRVHHPRHRDRGARPDGDEQRVVGRAEALARLRLEPVDVLVDLGLEPVRQRVAAM